jgi:hypothetical protein
VSREDRLGLVDHPNLRASPEALGDLESGEVASRLTRILERLLAEHEVSIKCIKTGHPKGRITESGKENDHFSFRALDIDAIDGVPVRENETSTGMIAVGQLLMGLSEKERATLVMGPKAWLDALGPGDRSGFRDDRAATSRHGDHIHIGVSE